MTTTLQSSIQLSDYVTEVLNFLQTVSIKFDPFTYLLNADYMEETGLANPEEAEWNIYYKNLCGQYSIYDTKIMVYVVELQEERVLTPELLSQYPETKALYRIPNPEFTTLCKKYPEQAGLIKHIIYPAESVAAVIEAKNLSVVAYDATLLPECERESILTRLNEYLDYVRTRLWVPELSYEELTPIGFFAMVRLSLLGAVLAQRVNNIKTEAVHPFHIWEYLISHGLGDYRNILSDTQARWLYRNISWIIKNTGKQETFIELAKNILGEMHIFMGGITMRQDTEDSLASCETSPEFIVTNIETDDVIGYLTLDEMLDKIEKAGYQPSTDENQRLELSTSLSTTNKDFLLTKYVELIRKELDTSWEIVLIEFLYDSFIYNYSENRLNYSFSFFDPVFSNSVVLSTEEMLALIHFINHAQFGLTPSTLPRSATVRTCYTINRPDKDLFPKEFYAYGSRFYTSGFVSTSTITDRIPYSERAFTSHGEFLNLLGDQFLCMYTDMDSVRHAGHAIYHEAMKLIYKNLMASKCVMFEWSGAELSYLYSDYLDAHPALATLLANYMSLDDLNDGYSQLLDTVVKILVPIAEEQFSGVVGVSQYVERLYTGLKNLFAQLCSYNITFLDTEEKIKFYNLLCSTTSFLDATVLTGTSLVFITNTPAVEILSSTHNPLGTVPIGIRFDLSDASSITETQLNVPMSADISLQELTTSAEIGVTSGLQVKIF